VAACAITCLQRVVCVVVVKMTAGAGGGRGGGQRNDDVFLRADHGCEKGATAPVQGLCSFNGEVQSVQAPTAQGDGNVCGVDLPVIACMQHALLEVAQ
jgi:hypothetical protein